MKSKKINTPSRKDSESNSGLILLGKMSVMSGIRDSVADVFSYYDFNKANQSEHMNDEFLRQISGQKYAIPSKSRLNDLLSSSNLTQIILNSKGKNFVLTKNQKNPSRRNKYANKVFKTAAVETIKKIRKR